MPSDRFSARTHDAVLFDLDGVLTRTAGLHARCWKRTFDEVLAACGRDDRFDLDRDYVAHVDGRGRHDGVRTFLTARGLELPEGDEDSPAGELSVHGIAARKQALVTQALAEDGVEAFPGSLRWLRSVREQGVRTAVVSSSANSAAVLRAAGIDGLFELTVDGSTTARLGLPGKPAPDAYLEAARRLGVPPERAVVVEDAVAGVAAGRAGAFDLVIGVARTATPAELRAAGADVVVGDLAELLP